jgi:hypothetical protein
MAINSQFFLNAADLSLATAVYIDSNLLNIAPDGFYGDGTISREQSGGVLLAATTCPACEVQVQCFEGIWEEGDPLHPDGGSVTYINADGDIVTQDLIWLENIVPIYYLEIISSVGVLEVSCGLELAYRSDGTSTSVDICDLETSDNEFYILGNVGCVIDTGSTAYNTNSALDIFDGGDLYYIIYVAICESTTDTYIVQINSVGYITVIGICEPPPP